MFISRWWKNGINKSKAANGRDRARRLNFARLFEPRLEALEPRWLPSTFTVSNNSDSGAGSLRAAITGANASPGSIINFNIGASGVVETITPASALPAITASVTIDGTTESGYTGLPLINLNGAGLNANGLQIAASNSTIRGLAVGGFGQAGLLISGGATGDLIANDFVGTNAAGTAAAANAIGIEIIGSANNTLNTDLISGNTGNGVTITGSGSTGDVVVNCKIGTNAAGTTALGNGADGVDVQGGASGNTIGALTSQPVATNLALWLNAGQGVTTNSSGQVTSWTDQSGNNHNGAVHGSGLTLVQNALNGQNAVQFTGSGDLSLSGQVLTSQQYTILAVVTDTHADTNFHEVFSDWNPSNGITSVFLGTTNNAPGRARFTDYMGGASDPNHTQTGVGRIASPTQPFVLTGVSSTGDASIYQDQTLIADKGSAIPTRNLTFTYYVGDQGSLGGELWQGDISELLVYNGALNQAQLQTDWSYLQAKYLPNVISGNAGDGVSIHDTGTAGNVVQGNKIGTDVRGTAKLANALNGVGITNGATANTVGGTATSARNIISGNTNSGVYAGDSGTSSNVVEGNFIGTDVTGTVALANSNYGVVTVASSGTTIGGTTAPARNILSGNSWGGVGMFGGSTNNLVEGNFIGTDVTGTRALGNALRGVAISSCAGNTVGGTSSGARNLISGNGWDGVSCEGASGNNLIEGNYIGTNVTGTAALGNLLSGVVVFGTASDNQIGGAAPGAGNLISANGTGGISIFSGSNLIGTNEVGTDGTGTASLANGGDAILFVSSAGNNTLGGTAATTITLNPGGVVEVDAPSTLENLTLVGNGLSMNVAGGLTLYGTLNLGAADGTTNGHVYFNGTQTLSGNGTVVFGKSASNALYARGDNGNNPATLTLGSGITVQGGSGIVGAYYGNDSVVNDGTITLPGGQTLTIGGANWVNNGTIAANGSTVNLGGSLTTAALGNFTDAGGAVNLTGTLNNSAAVLNLTPTQGAWHVTAGTIRGGTINATGGSQLTLTGTAGAPVGSGGTLDGVTLNGNLDLSATNANGTVLDGLTLNGTATLGSAADLYFKGSQTLGGNATVVFQNQLANALIAATDGMTLTLGPNVTIRGGGNQSFSAQVGHSGYWGGGNNVSVVNQGTINADTTGMTIGLYPSGTGTLTSTGTLAAQNGGTLYVGAPLTLGGQAILNESSSSLMQFAGNLLTTTANASQYNPQGTVTLSGPGTVSSPQLLEAPSQDLGGASAGFSHNSAFGTLILAGNTYAELVDQAHNSPGGGPEAVYANAVIVPAGATLDLNGLNLYVRAEQVGGTVLHGTITLIPDSGPLTLSTATAGAISPAGNLDEWTFFGRGGNSVTVSVNPGTSGSSAPVAPQLNWAQVQLLDANGNVLASASNATAGAVLTLNNVKFPADGVYKIHVSAAPGHAAGTGNYVVTAWDTTPNVQTLNVNQTTTGTIATPFSVDQWTFSAAANTQVQFDLLAESASGLNFSLAGPGGFTGFSNLTGSSALLTLSTSGIYTLSAQGTGGAVGKFTFTVAQTTPTVLPLATTYSGTFAGTGQTQLFAVSVPSAEPLFLQLADSAAKDHVELYARFGALPTRAIYDFAANGTGSTQSLLVPRAAAGTWYVLVYAESVAVAPSSFTLRADASPAVLTAVTPVHYGTNAVASLTLNGAGFTTATSVALVASNNTTVYPASSVSFNTFTQLTATVNLAGVPQGIYSVRVNNADGSSDTLPGAFTVTAPGQANLQTHLILPGALGRHESATIYVQYSNTGSVAMSAPVLLLESSVAFDRPLLTLDPALRVAGFWTSAVPQGYSNTVEILASGKVPGVLEPGESVTVPVYYAGMQQPWDLREPQFHFDLRIFTTTDTDVVDWGSLQSTLQPAGIPNAAWSVIYSNLISAMGGTTGVYFGLGNGPPLVPSQPGNTWGGYVQFLDNEASYLGQLGESVTDVNKLWGFGVQQADNALSPVGPALTSATDDAVATPGSLSLSFSRVFASTVGGRNTLGPLGYGWSTPWQTTATMASDGTVTVTGADGAQRVFQPDSRRAGTFFSGSGDTGTLHTDGKGGYLLTEANGTTTDYNPNGTPNTIQDTNGNRITAGYANGRLVSLTASSGQSITIGYNSSGLISTASDSEGRTTTYAYDVANRQLISVTGYNGRTTTYAYDVPPPIIDVVEIIPPQLLHALTSITFAGGTHQYFSYDGMGRLTGTSADGGAQPQSFAYSLGQVGVTNGTGDTSHLYYNEQGLLVKSLDPLGNVTLNTYDGNFNLTKVTNALGQSESYSYNAASEVTSSTDFLGYTTHSSYSGPFHELSLMTDANGNTTGYTYSTAGDLLMTTYANGTSSSATYDPQGNATSFLNANGQPIKYAYNAAGQKTNETFSDGSTYTYAYNARGDLLTATDATGTTTFTYDAATERLTMVAYPSGTSLTFGYNAAGQRASMVDQTGFRVNYGYDSVGRLSQLTDANGNLIVTYRYDADGRLSQKTNGNGTYTAYQYDAGGNILHLVNYGPGGSINSRFDYAYNALGLETSEGTVDGTWTYSYDADGQLVHAVFVSTNPNIVSQDLAYAYDAMGNRITTVIDGVTTAYISNNVNEYTSVAGVKYTYDADGNLTSDGANTYTYNSPNQLVGVSGPSGTTAFAYNALGQRATSTTGGVTTQYLYDPSGLSSVVGEYTGGRALVADYTYGLGLTSRVTAGGSYYYDFDALGSTVGISNSSGASVSRYSYLPFGGSLSSSTSLQDPYQFAGQSGIRTDSSGLAFARARYFELSGGRFVSLDPIGLAGGDTNLYRYAFNQPVTRVDASGESVSGIVEKIRMFVPGPSEYFTKGFAQIGADWLVNAGVSAETAFGLETLAGDFLPEGGIFYTDYEIYQNSAEIQYRLLEAMDYLPFLGGPVGHDDLQDWADKWDGEHPLLGDQLLSLRNWFDRLLGPTIPNGAPGDGRSSASDRPKDPNALIGPAGYGTPNFIAPNGTALPYQIQFENDPTATAPAQAVTITEQLDANLDWSTFQLTEIGWGDTVLSIPAGSQYYATAVPMTYNGQTFDVLVEAGIHVATGQVYATFQSIDPDSQLPPDVLTGFLPPEDGTGRGTGYLNYTIQPKAGLPTGTAVLSVANVTFDQNGAIATDQVNDEDPTLGIDPAKQALVTIDAGAPTSSIAALPAITNATSFTVSWSGQDDAGGSGIATFDVFVSDNGGPFTAFLQGTTDTSATFTGSVGHTYSFYSIATDNVGNVEAVPGSPEATTTIQLAPTLAVTSSSSDNTSTYGDQVTLTAVLAVTGFSIAPAAGELLTFMDGTTTLGTGTLSSAGVATFTTSATKLIAGGHTITAVYGGDTDFASTNGTLQGGQTVNQAGTTTKLTSSAPNNTSTYGQAVTFTATETTSNPGAGTPTGTVSFYSGSTFLGRGTLDGNGQATFTTSALPVGQDTIKAVYDDATDSGATLNANFLSSYDTLALTVNAAGAIDVTDRVQVSRSGLTANRRAHTFSGTIGITNTSTAAISGGLVFVWKGLSSGVAVQSVSVTIDGVTTQLTVGSDGNGNQEVVISSRLLAQLAVGQTVTLNVVYFDPTFAAVNFVPDLFSDPRQ